MMLDARAGNEAALARDLGVPAWEVRGVLVGRVVVSCRLARALGYERLGPQGRPHRAWRPLQFRFVGLV